MAYVGRVSETVNFHQKETCWGPSACTGGLLFYRVPFAAVFDGRAGNGANVACRGLIESLAGNFAG